jgi:multidrug efflux pump
VILSDVSIRRPVFATVLSLFIVLAGLVGLDRLPVREYPDVDAPVVSIDTRYRGASADVVENKVTRILEDQAAGIEGVRRLASRSRDERSEINIEFSLDRNIDEAANDVRDRISRAVEDLPQEAERPEIAKADADTRPIMWITFTSDRHSVMELTDIAERVLVDRMSIVDGVARIQFGGARRFAMRVWLDRKAMAARGVTAEDVIATLRRENVELPAGRLESRERELTLRTRTGLDTEQDFRELVIRRGDDGSLLRLGDVARIQIGPEDPRAVARANQRPAISLGIVQLSKANTVEVSSGVRAAMEAILPTLPEGVELKVNFDRADFIKASMREVVKALGFAMALVLVVLYLFLGDIRTTLVPAVTIPICVIAAFAALALLGYSINVLILLGLVIAIGLVVDDAIVVLENIYRRIEQKQPPLLAALEGSREIGFAVIATTLVLVAVILPISALEGDVGRLFREFGVAVSAAVIISSVVALSLIPMICSRIFHVGERHRGYARLLDLAFLRLGNGYRRALRLTVRYPWIALAVAAVVSTGAWSLYRELPVEYSPREDRGIFFITMGAPPGASLEYTERYTMLMEDIIMQEVAAGDVMRVLIRVPGGTGEVNTSRAIVLLENWDKRKRSAEEIADAVRKQLDVLPGARFRVVLPQGLGVRGSSRPIQLVIGGDSYEELAEWRNVMLAAAADIPEVVGLDSDYDERKPKLDVIIDRNRAADLGVSLDNIGRTLETMLGSRSVTTYIDRGLEYKVIVQGRELDRMSIGDLSNLYVRSQTSGELIPLSSLVALQEKAGPAELNRMDRMRAITLSAGVAPGYTLGQALDALESRARALLPPHARLSYDGESRQLKETGQALDLGFVFALLVVFLVLAAQFESFRNPLVIMMTVPLAVTGALLGLKGYGASLNVYSQIGIIMLIGLAAKNGVLIVEFANQLRDRGYEFLDAVVEAAVIRLRPILMTSACTSIGALPLLLATGAGAESRQPIGIVIFYGVLLSTLLTLFVVPGFYALLARNTRSPQHMSRVIDQLKEAVRKRDQAAAQKISPPVS